MNEIRNLELRVTPLDYVDVDRPVPCGDAVSVFAKGSWQEFDLALGGPRLALEVPADSPWPLAPSGEFHVQGLPAEWRVHQGDRWQRLANEEGVTVTLRPCQPMG